MLLSYASVDKDCRTWSETFIYTLTYYLIALLKDLNNPYPWPLFSSYPPPKDYLPVEQISKMTAFEEGW